MKIIKKLFYTTLTTFIILTIYTLSNVDNNTLRTNLEIDDITNIKTNCVYLLNKDNYLVKVDIFLDKKDKKDEIINIINYLKKSNKKISEDYRGYIPDNTEVLDIEIKNNTLYLNLSQAFVDDNIDLSVRGLVRSITELKHINTIDLKVEGNYIEGYSRPLKRDLPINKEYSLTNRSNVNKVIIYYLSEDNNYIPVTKYVNDDRDKIEIVVDELKNNDKNDLVSYLNSNVELLNYKEENNVFFVNFNKYLIDDKNIKDYNLREIAYSIFDNYNVMSVMFQIENHNLEIINKN